jgi:hypothetical protein
MMQVIAYSLPSNNPMGLKTFHSYQNTKTKEVMSKLHDLKETNKSFITEATDLNKKIIEMKRDVAEKTRETALSAKELYVSINQAKKLMEEMKSHFTTYESLTRDYETSLDLMKGGNIPNSDYPSDFIINITNYFEVRINQLKDKVTEIEELVKMPDSFEDDEEIDKVVLVLD